MLQPFNYVVVKIGNFHNNLVEKSHKDVYDIQNDNSGSSKQPLQKMVKGQMSANFRICVQFITLGWFLNRFPIWNCNKTI